MGHLMRYWQAFPRMKPLLLVYRLTLRLHLASPSDRVVVGQPDQEAKCKFKRPFWEWGCRGRSLLPGRGVSPLSPLFPKRWGDSAPGFFSKVHGGTYKGIQSDYE